MNYIPDLNEDELADQPSDKLQYLEDVGTKLIERVEKSYWNIRSRCQTLATMLFVGVVLIAKWIIENPNHQIKGYALSILVIWFVGCGVLIAACLFARNRLTAYSTPATLYFKDEELNHLKARRIAGFGFVANSIQKMNTRMGKVFNYVMTIVFAFPFIIFLFCL